MMSQRSEAPVEVRTGEAGLLAFFRLYLEVEGQRRYLGLVNHVRILDNSSNPTPYPHMVRFWDGENYRFLEGDVHIDEDREGFVLSMGGSKRYIFRLLRRS
ncbi:hypothetical protein [Thermodesulforhabdus norvegica]|uniref:Uncharacterized protein n=1 Tax=Thermodesulforhabdus norvegica TaxID=39841 RepID=A0A1I4S5D9_9BACT|nr:hypothetical protein [Thermodesulforhabdus norvegica]SFM59504.1 hypothetical protein SAMN05660836_00758 [Thermodesulforhabdus norvegica]